MADYCGKKKKKISDHPGEDIDIGGSTLQCHDGDDGDPNVVTQPASCPAPPGPVVMCVKDDVVVRRRRRLVLHVDLNNTVLVSDAVTGQGTVAALEYFLTSVTWGRMDKGKWEWLSDAPSLLPPCEGAVSYYSQFGRVPGFTSAAGRRFRPILDEHLELLRWPEGLEEDEELCVRGEDGRLYHWILPSFFQLLRDLTEEEGPEFAVLFRTFGSDLPRVLSAVSRALTQGTHPLFPDLPQLKLSVNSTPGKIRCSKKCVVLSRAEERVSTHGGERGLYQYLSSVHGLGGFQDHFDWWARNTYSILGGKPLWVDPFDPHVQHIFIDDNIRQNDQDTIVHPRVFLSPDSSETRTAFTSELYDVNLVQNDLLRAISDPGYFSQRIRVCQANYHTNVQQGGANYHTNVQQGGANDHTNVQQGGANYHTNVQQGGANYHTNVQQGGAG